MIDYRFTGRLGTEYQYIDVRFRTDAMRADDGFFNITQIQTGQNFDVTDKQHTSYLKWFSGTFKETNTSLGALKQFAIQKNLDLRAYKDGVETIIYNDDSASLSR